MALPIELQQLYNVLFREENIDDLTLTALRDICYQECSNQILGSPGVGCHGNNCPMQLSDFDESLTEEVKRTIKAEY